MRLLVKVAPGSSRDHIVGWMGDVLKVRVTAPAEGGRANAAVEKVIAKALGVPKNNVLIVAGKTSSRKVIEIDGLHESQVHKRLSFVAG